MASSIHVRRGKDGRVAWGAGPQNLGLANYTITERADKLEYTTFESTNGQEENSVGVEGVDQEYEGDWDAAVNRYDSPPNITPTDAAGPPHSYLTKSDPTSSLFPLLTIFS